MSVIIILFFFIGCFFFSYLERRINIPYLKWIFIIPFCVLIASRSQLVPDTEIYLNYFLSEDTDLTKFVNYGFEFGFQFLTKLIKLFVGENYWLYFAIITLINSLLIYSAVDKIYRLYIKESGVLQEAEYSQLSDHNGFYSIVLLTLYVAFFGLYFNSIILRVGIAFSLLIHAVSYALKSNKKISDFLLIVFFVFLSVLFHATALIGIVITLIVLFSRKYSFKFYISFLIIAGVFYFLNLTSKLGGTVFNFFVSLNALTLLSSKLSLYDSQSLFVAEGIAVKFVFFWLMSFVLLFTESQSKLYYKLFNVYLVGLAIFALMRSVLLIERVTDYFLLFSFILFYLFLSQKNGLKFWMYYLGIVLIQVIFVMRIINRDMM